MLHNGPQTHVHIKGVGVMGRSPAAVILVGILLLGVKAGLDRPIRVGVPHELQWAVADWSLEEVELVTTTSQQGLDFFVCDAGEDLEGALPLKERAGILVVNRLHPMVGPVNLEELLADGAMSCYGAEEYESLWEKSLGELAGHIKPKSEGEIVELVAKGLDVAGIISPEGLWAGLKPLQLVDCQLQQRAYLIPVPQGWLADRLASFYPRRRTKIDQFLKQLADQVEEEDPEVLMMAVGDIMFERKVKGLQLKRGWTYPFEQVAPTLKGADLVFANLECPLGVGGRFLNMFRGEPESVWGLAYGGVDVVSLANNHILDYDNQVLFQTMDILGEAGIGFAGAGRNLAEARTPLIVEQGGLRIAFLAYTEMWFVYTREPHNWAATDILPGVAPARLDLVKEDVRSARKQADVVVVSFHWGQEYKEEPTQAQYELGRGAVDAGAHLVLGHHPHVLQGVEFYKGGVIVYSLGNFVFDELRPPLTEESIILQAVLKRGKVEQIDFLPVRIVNCQPRILSSREGRYIIQRIERLSRRLLPR
ncbi:MAG: CapA family protein [Firmicutes bacterium]|nr:CapA family protein [Bacillota bacterium]